MESQNNHQTIEEPKQKYCPKCGRKMFWYDSWKEYICESWLEMEGGCPTESMRKSYKLKGINK